MKICVLMESLTSVEKNSKMLVLIINRTKNHSLSLDWSKNVRNGKLMCFQSVVLWSMKCELLGFEQSISMWLFCAVLVIIRKYSIKDPIEMIEINAMSESVCLPLYRSNIVNLMIFSRLTGDTGWHVWNVRYWYYSSMIPIDWIGLRAFMLLLNSHCTLSF